MLEVAGGGTGTFDQVRDQVSEEEYRRLGKMSLTSEKLKLRLKE